MEVRTEGGESRGAEGRGRAWPLVPRFFPELAEQRILNSLLAARVIGKVFATAGEGSTLSLSFM